MTAPVAPKLNSRLNITVPFNGTCPKCGGKNVRLEAVGLVVNIVHDVCLHGQQHRAYAGPVSGLPAASPLALELLARL